MPPFTLEAALSLIGFFAAFGVGMSIVLLLIGGCVWLACRVFDGV